jgi:hypothetical protein
MHQPPDQLNPGFSAARLLLAWFVRAWVYVHMVWLVPVPVFFLLVAGWSLFGFIFVERNNALQLYYFLQL